LASLSSARAGARDAQRQADAIQMRNALALYQLDNNGFPACPAGCTGSSLTSTLDMPLTGLAVNSEPSSWWGLALGKIAYAASKYIGQVPTDPTNSPSTGYVFYYITSPVSTAGYVDTNGNTVNLATQASFYYQSETDTKKTGSSYYEGISLGQQDFVTYSTTNGWLPAINSIHQISTGITSTP